MVGMRQGGQELGLRWLLFFLLLLGLVGMHHFMPPTSHHQPAAAVSSVTDMHDDAPAHAPDSPAPTPAHDLMHLCMAVLSAMAGLLLIALLLTTSWPAQAPVFPSPPLIRRADRPPDRYGLTLLISFGVLRL
jgi:hypothetical protein